MVSPCSCWIGLRITDTWSRFRSTGLWWRRACAVAIPWGCLGALAIALAGCERLVEPARAVATSESLADDRLQVVCTTAQVADLVRRVGGTRIDCQTLMGPGVDPHLYKPSHSDLRRLIRAEVIFYSGLHLEGRLADVLEQLARKKPTHAVTDPLRRQHPDRLRTSPEFLSSHDPHVWFDVALWAECLPEISWQLAKLRPKHAREFERQSEAYRLELSLLDTECRRQLETIPAAQRVLVTAHDAFGYFGRAYGLEVRGLQGLSTADEADLRALNDLVSMLVDRRIRAIFVESSVPVRNLQSLVRGCRAQGHTVRVGGELYSDAMGAMDSPEGTYPGMIRHNVRTIVTALRE